MSLFVTMNRVLKTRCAVSRRDFSKEQDLVRMWDSAYAQTVLASAAPLYCAIGAL